MSPNQAWELSQGALVAGQLNARDGSDYIATPSTHEPADVVLVSESGRFANRDAQVVSIPLDYQARDDKHTVRNIERTLIELLRHQGMCDALVFIILSGPAELHGMTHGLLEALAELIVRRGHHANAEIPYETIYEHSPELADYVHTVNISHHPEIYHDVQVEIPAGSAVPIDGRWIEDAVRKKLEHYGGEQAVRDLMLIIGVRGFVDDQQVEAFQQAFAEASLPFAEIWINTPFHGTHCLKAAAQP
jgi:hypothetical protein